MFDDEDYDSDRIDPRSLPIFKKGQEIYDVVDSICQLIYGN